MKKKKKKGQNNDISKHDMVKQSVESRGTYRAGALDPGQEAGHDGLRRIVVSSRTETSAGLWSRAVMRTTADRGESCAAAARRNLSAIKTGSYVGASTMVEDGNNNVENSQVEVFQSVVEMSEARECGVGATAGGSELLVWAGNERECSFRLRNDEVSR